MDSEEHTAKPGGAFASNARSCVASRSCSVADLFRGGHKFSGDPKGEFDAALQSLDSDGDAEEALAERPRADSLQQREDRAARAQDLRSAERGFLTRTPFASHRSPLLSGVYVEKMKTNLGKTAYYPRSRSTVQRNLREPSTQKATQCPA
mgnify:CR=1 FL=1